MSHIRNGNNTAKADKITQYMKQIIIIINNNSTTMFMVLSSWPQSLREFTRFIWWMQTERWVAANPQTKPTDLGCESVDKWLPYHPHPPFVIITQLLSPKADTQFTIPQRVESWVNLGTAGRVCSPCPRLYIAVADMITTRLPSHH